MERRLRKASPESFREYILEFNPNIPHNNAPTNDIPPAAPMTAEEAIWQQMDSNMNGYINSTITKHVVTSGGQLNPSNKLSPVHQIANHQQQQQQPSTILSPGKNNTAVGNSNTPSLTKEALVYNQQQMQLNNPTSTAPIVTSANDGTANTGKKTKNFWSKLTGHSSSSGMNDNVSVTSNNSTVPGVTRQQSVDSYHSNQRQQQQQQQQVTNSPGGGSGSMGSNPTSPVSSPGMGNASGAKHSHPSDVHSQDIPQKPPLPRNMNPNSSPNAVVHKLHSYPVYNSHTSTIKEEANEDDDDDSLEYSEHEHLDGNSKYNYPKNTTVATTNIGNNGNARVSNQYSNPGLSSGTGIVPSSPMDHSNLSSNTSSPLSSNYNANQGMTINTEVIAPNSREKRSDSMNSESTTGLSTTSSANTQQRKHKGRPSISGMIKFVDRSILGHAKKPHTDSLDDTSSHTG